MLNQLPAWDVVRPLEEMKKISSEKEKRNMKSKGPRLNILKLGRMTRYHCGSA